MKYSYFIIPLLIVHISLSKAQSSDPLIGTWKNTYGSVLNISWHNTDGMFLGTYSSSTGATGKYIMVGNSPYNALKVKAGASQPLSMSILWRPIDGAKGTPDEEWTSSMTGQVVTNKSGKWVIEVRHSLNASTPLPAVEVQQEGRYVETLTFERSSSYRGKIDPLQARIIESIEEKNQSSIAPPTPLKNPLEGSWSGDFLEEYPYLNIDVVDIGSSRPGIFVGSIIQEGKKISVVGCTTPAAPTKDFQSVALTFMNSDNYGSICYSASGFLYQGNRLELVFCKSRKAPYSSKYTAVQITSKAIFHRDDVKPITITMGKNNFTNNGASEWTANLTVGSAFAAPTLKLGIDTGGNFVWVNSTQCTTTSCTSNKHIQFSPSASATFKWLDKTPTSVSWGPWGKGMANLGNDYISIGPDRQALRYNMKLITRFDETPQFDEFLWDGAIALPANSDQMVQPTSNLIKSLVDNGQAIPVNNKIGVAFYFDPDSKHGSVTIGGWDSTLVDTSSKLNFKYEAYKTVPYLWCAPLTSFSIGDKQIASSGSYSFDTGSSALKGDSARMQQTLNYAQQVFKSTGKWPTMTFEMGVNNKGKTGRLKLSAEQYVQLIEEGERTGEKVPQIQTLSGTPDLYLQGSTLLNHVYSVFWWDTHLKADGTYNLTAREVWLFNKKNGPEIIQKAQNNATLKSSQKPENAIVYPNPTQGTVNVNFVLSKKSPVTIYIYTLQGELLYTKKYPQFSAGSNSLHIKSRHLTSTSKNSRNVVLQLNSNTEILLIKRISIY